MIIFVGILEFVVVYGPVGWFEGLTSNGGWVTNYGRVFSATVRWPFDGAQGERTGWLGGVVDRGWFDGLTTNGRACHEQGILGDF